MAETLIQPSLAQDPNVIALAALAERITYLDVSPVITHDIDRVPASVLPHLADQFHMRHTVSWRRAQTDAERRGLVKAAIARHRIKGTLAGFRLAAQDAGGRLAGAVVPPAKTYVGAALTMAERNAFVARHPQLRIYPQRLTGHKVGALLSNLHPGAAVYPVQTDAALRLAPRAYLFRDGVETPLDVIERALQVSTRQATTITEVRATGTADALAFCGRPCRWPAKTDAAGRMYRLVLDSTYLEHSESLRRQSVSPGLSPITIRYDWIAGEGRAAGIHAGRFVSGHLQRSTARERIYKRTWLFDPDVDITRRGGMSFCDSSRLSMPAFHAELAVALRGRANPRHAWRFVQGFLAQSDLTDYHDAFEAMRDVARASDRIAIDTAVVRPLSAGEHLSAGSVTAGDWQ